MADEKPAVPTPAPDVGEAEYQAELKKRVAGTDGEPEEKPKEPEGEESEEKDDEEPTDADADPVEDEDEKPKDDEKGSYSKAFRKLQKEESNLQAFKAQVLDKERQVAQREQKVQGGEQELLGFIKELRIDPFGTLMKHGILKDDDAEYASKQLYYRSKAAQADPKNRVEADRLQREHAASLESRSTRQELEQIKRDLAERDQRVQRQAADTDYLGKLNSAVTKTKETLLSKAMAKNPERTDKELREQAHKLAVAKGTYPDPGLVILAWVKERKAILADYGVAEPVATKQAKSNPAAKEKGPTNGTSKTASSPEDNAAEAAYQKELRERLNGTYAGD